MFLLRLLTLCLVGLVGSLCMGQTENRFLDRKDKNAKTQIKKADSEKLKKHIEAVLKEIPTSPGVAVAVIRGDKVIFNEGFGYRNLEEKLPVNAQTQFYLASTTKSFTAATAKILDEEGKIDLDVPIKTYFPNLKLKPPLSAEQITLRDLLTHRGGITSTAVGIRTSYTGQYDKDVILKALAEYSRPISPAYRYTNIGYVITGLALEEATGETWQKLTRDKIFDPVEMKNTSSYASKAINSGNYAIPYRSDGGSFTRLPYKNDATMHAAGGTVSTSEDLAKWLIVMMNDGKVNGKQIISSRSMKEILSPQINQNRNFFRYNRYAYGLGWNIATYKGEEFIHCFGTYAGFRPHVSFMPEHNVGVVVLVNESLESIMLPDLIANEIYDHLLGKRDLDIGSNTEIQEYVENLERRRKRISETEVKTINSNEEFPSLPLEKYPGTYKSDEFGEVEISIKDKDIFAQMGNLSAKLKRETADSFQADFLVFRRSLKLEFTYDEKKKINGIIMDGDKYVRVD